MHELSASPSERPRTRGWSAGMVVTAAAALLVGGLAAPAQAIAKPPAAVDRVLKDGRITESSGLARSYLQKGRLWTHNDSGDSARVLAIGRGGATTATYTLTGASHRDWEGMASVTRKGVSYLYLADIGDNGKTRPEIYVHRIREPRPSAASGSRTPITWAFAYPDGPHNAEAILVRPGTLRIFIVTKVNGGPGAIYRAPARLSRSHPNLLTRVRSAPEGVSDAVFLGKNRFVIRVYQTGFLYASMAASPVAFRFPDKGEGVARGFDGRHVYISSEGAFTPIWRVGLP